jgi:hypothetical protein
MRLSSRLEHFKAATLWVALLCAAGCDHATPSSSAIKSYSDSPCPASPCFLPSPGCWYSAETRPVDPNGCPIGCPPIVCPPCGDGLCDPQIGESCSTCPVDCGVCQPYCVPPDCAAPPDGCTYGPPVPVDDRGCPTSCGTLSCSTVCPLIDCPAPPEGCRYIPPPKDENGCPTGCGAIVCDPGRCSTVLGIDCPPGFVCTPDPNCVTWDGSCSETCQPQQQLPCCPQGWEMYQCNGGLTRCHNPQLACPSACLPGTGCDFDVSGRCN